MSNKTFTIQNVQNSRFKTEVIQNSEISDLKIHNIGWLKFASAFNTFTAQLKSNAEVNNKFHTRIKIWNNFTQNFSYNIRR